MPRQLLTINEAAQVMGVSRNHARRLVEEADVLGKKARWRYGREIVDLSPVDAVRRTLRINIAAVLPGLEAGPGGTVDPVTSTPGG